MITLIRWPSIYTNILLILDSSQITFQSDLARFTGILLILNSKIFTNLLLSRAAFSQIIIQFWFNPWPKWKREVVLFSTLDCPLLSNNYTQGRRKLLKAWWVSSNMGAQSAPSSWYKGCLIASIYISFCSGG